jgi:group I intron endonuclease
MFFVYRITNLKNGKIYVGQTNNLSLRWIQHKSEAKLRPHKPLHWSIRKHGAENFLFEPLATCRTLDDVNETEILIIAQENSCDPEIGYNLDPGGKSHPRSEETGRKIALGLKKHYEEHESPLLGKKLSEAHRKAVSEGSMGKPGTNLGKKFDEEWKFKQSSSLMEKEGKKKFSKEVELQVIDFYRDQGKSTHWIWKETKIAKNTVKSILERNGVKLRETPKSVFKNGLKARKFSDEQEKKICEKFMNEMVSIREMGKIFGCSDHTINKVLERNNIDKKTNFKRGEKSKWLKKEQ